MLPSKFNVDGGLQWLHELKLMQQASLSDSSQWSTLKLIWRLVVFVKNKRRNRPRKSAVIKGKLMMRHWNGHGLIRWKAIRLEREARVEVDDLVGPSQTGCAANLHHRRLLMFVHLTK